MTQTTTHDYADKVDIDDLVSATDAAQIAGVKLDTFTSYVNRGYAPEHVAQIAGRRLWSRAAINEWVENRPGQGSRTDLKQSDTDAER